MHFSIDDKVMVVLKEQCYFDPWDQSREVSLLPKGAMQRQLLEIRDPDGWTDKYTSERYMKKGIMEIKSFAGRYVGDRPGLIKVQPLYGLQHQFSEYFIIRENQIKEVRKYHIESSKEPAPNSLSTKN